jgi:hypothetical protein
MAVLMTTVSTLKVALQLAQFIQAFSTEKNQMGSVSEFAHPPNSINVGMNVCMAVQILLGDAMLARAIAFK